ncbi:A/G-specific adenine glycosylase [Clostridia bacterium]|nr:A/G-specific adenine glycosylase [Clostridia bacterium]
MKTPQATLSSEQERILALQPALLTWYRENARPLPWRKNISPYRTWISEIMLQQTRIQAAIGYFHRFTAEIPDIHTLANISTERLLKLWEGLGYYNRAKNLQAAAQILEKHYQGNLPANYEQLKQLPGIGPYTAGAIASIAFGLPTAAVDGNVLRVVSRLLAKLEDISLAKVKKKMENLLFSVLPANEAGAFNQALMELGELYCLPKGKTKCLECPISSFCLAKEQQLVEQIPFKTAKSERKKEQKTILIFHHQDTIAIQKREQNGVLKGLYEFPNLPGHLNQNELKAFLQNQQFNYNNIHSFSPSKHIFTHIEWHMIAYQIDMTQKPDTKYIWAKLSELQDKYPIPTVFKNFFVSRSVK